MEVRAVGLLRDRRVVVTSAGAVGSAVAKRCVEEGAHVQVWDLSPVALKRASYECAGSAGAVTTRVVDVTDEQSVEAAAAAAARAFRHIDGLVCAAAVLAFSPTLLTTVESWDRQFAVNSRGVFLCNREVARRMTEHRSGSIVNIASMAALRGAVDLGAYSASKAAVVALTQSLAQEVGPAGVRVNAICPGQVDGPMGDATAEHYALLSNMTSAQYLHDTVEQTPLRRLASPSDVADGAVWLLSDLASFVTGESLTIGGGIAA